MADVPADSVADPAGAKGLQLGFRGFAAGFQPGLDGFLRHHRDQLSGLTRIDGAGDFLSCISDMRPDYVLLGDASEPADILADIGAAARSAHLGVLIAGALPKNPESFAPGLILDAVASDASAKEVALVLRALMRRSRPQAMVGRSAWRDLELDEACLTFSIHGQSVSLSLEVFSVLGLMMDDPDRVWERPLLHRMVFGAGSRNDIRSIDTRISRARRHVSSVLGHDPIRTVRGVGYALVPEP